MFTQDNYKGRDSSKNVEIFKNTTCLIFTNMFRQYIRHRQCDGYSDLKRACYKSYVTLRWKTIR